MFADSLSIFIVLIRSAISSTRFIIGVPIAHVQSKHLISLGIQKLDSITKWQPTTKARQQNRITTQWLYRQNDV
jgi:hypothetical protein